MARARVDLIARSGCWYDGCLLKVGQRFSARPEHVKVLTITRRADLAVTPSGQVRFEAVLRTEIESARVEVQRDIDEALEILKPKRTYKRRDMQAEE